MKILDVKYDEKPNWYFVSDKIAELANDFEMAIYTDEGVIRYKYKKGCRFDGTSCPWFLRRLLDLPRFNRKTKRKVQKGFEYWLAFMAHDAAGDCHLLSFELNNELFRLLLIRSGRSERRAYWAHFGVSSWIGEDIYYNKVDTCNNGLIDIQWDSK